MRNKPLQLFSPERIKQDAGLTPDQIVQFLEDYKNIAAGEEGPRKLISLRVPEKLLEQFKAKARGDAKAYQTQIVELMRRWLRS